MNKEPDLSSIEWLKPYKELLEYKVFGVALVDPILFCIKAFVIIVLIQLAVWVIKYIFKPARLENRKRKFDTTSALFLRKLLITIVYIIGISSILFLVPALRTLATSLLAGAGILAMAVGLASQEALSNFVGGIFIIMAKPFRIGDYISLDSGVAGTVSEISLRHTVITTAENRMVIIPNSKVNSAIITNSTIHETKTCSFIEVGVAYTENLDKCMTEMRTLIETDGRVIDNRTKTEKATGIEKIIIRVIELGEYAITLRAYAWTNSSSDAFTLKCDMLKAVKERFEEVGIEIPYPYMNLVNKI